MCWLQFSFPHQVNVRLLSVACQTLGAVVCVWLSGLKVRELLAFAVPKIEPGSVVVSELFLSSDNPQC